MIQSDVEEVEMVDGWRKITLAGAKNFKLKISLQKNEDKSVFFVAISSEPSCNSETKYHKLQGGQSIIQIQSEGTVFVNPPVLHV